MNYLSKPLFALLLLTSMTLNPLIGQSQLAGNVTDEARRPLAFANVLLLSPADSALVSGVVTAEDGAYRFEQVANGTYFLSVTMLGFSQHYSEVFTMQSSKNMGTIVLNPDAAQLDEVTIVAKNNYSNKK
jgi:hypothetical protein